ncbi:MAG: hypothetical protein JW755_02960 [Candidatus Aminicenantes bacterium]|nr:hypothetical protein [Candidatus Aminicenantes bacterium]
MERKKKLVSGVFLCLVMIAGFLNGTAMPGKKTITIPRLTKSPKIDGIKDNPYLGWSNVYGLYFSLKPNKQLRLSTNVNKQTFWKQWGGEQVFDYNVIRQIVYLSDIQDPFTAGDLGL